MFKNSDNDNDIEAGLTHSGRPFIEVPLANLFKKNYRDEGFYSGEEEDLTDGRVFRVRKGRGSKY
jgi:hypothetical protein